MRRWLGFVFAAGALLLVVPGAAAAAGWHFATLDGAGGPDGRINAQVGSNSAVTLYGGQPHAWYLDGENGDLRHAWLDGTRWSFETLDGAGGPDGRVDAYVGWDTAVTLYGGQPHLWYRSGTNGDLRHAWWDGTRWSFETLDGAGGPDGRINANVGYANAAALYGGQPHLWYHDLTNGNLRHAWWNGARWSFQTLDGAGGPGGRVQARVGYYNAVMLSGGQPHVWYLDSTNGDLRHAWWTGTQWTFQTLDGAGGPNGRIDAKVGWDGAVTLYGGQPHLWYRDAENGDLRHAWSNGTQWTFETLDGAGGANGRIDAEVGSELAVTLYGAQPHLWYRDAQNGDLRHAWWNGAQWWFETLDGAGGPNGRIDANVGDDNAAILYGAQPYLLYYDATGADLRLGWWN